MTQIKGTLILTIFLLLSFNRGISQLGELPSHPTIFKSIEELQVELVFRIWVDPEFYLDRIPENTKLKSPRSMGISTSKVAEEYQDYICSIISIMAADSIRLDHELLSNRNKTAYSEVFWWHLIDKGELKNEPKAKGFNHAIEYGYWVPDRRIAEKMNRSKWKANIGRSSVQQISDGWKFLIEIDGDKISGICNLEGEVKDQNYELPGFMTVWQSGTETKAFTVYTYEGSKSQRCRIDELEIQGDGILARSMRESLKAEGLFGWIEFGWHAKAGQYLREN